MRFSSVQFFLKHDEQSMRKRKLRNLLLLATRVGDESLTHGHGDHVAQFRAWARERYGIELDRREALVLMGAV